MELSGAEQAALDAARARDAELSRDSARRRREGIVHTPPALARFCARAVDEVLARVLGISRGLADARVHVVDPACGPGAFLAAAWTVAGGHGDVCARMTGIDVDDAALARATRVLAGAPQLALRCDDMLKNDTLPSQLAAAAPVTVVLGNPPWTVSASRPTPHMQGLLADFRKDDRGEPLPEKKLGVLADAYVRFFRAAIEVARHARGGAVIALVTNSSFLDGPVHRGMRAMLLREFDAIDVLDLGGNALVGRSKGTRDGNVFGVRPGVAFTVLVRGAGTVRRGASVRYARVHGVAQEKLAWLEQSNMQDADLQPLVPQAPLWRFGAPVVAPREYARFVSLPECMPFHREGIQSNRDAFVMDRDKLALLQRLRAFAAGGTDDVASRPLAHYDPALARRSVARALTEDPDGTRGISVRRIAYRPFDMRWFCPVPPVCHRPRADLLAAFEHSSLALIAVRKDRGSAPYTHFGASVVPIDNCYVSTRSSCRARAFPVCTPEGRDNLAPALRDVLSELAGRQVDAGDFVRYSLCVLASAQYRERFEAALRLDYPRVPIPIQREHLEACIAAGNDLALVLTAPQRDDGALERALLSCGLAVEPVLREASSR